MDSFIGNLLRCICQKKPRHHRFSRRISNIKPWTIACCQEIVGIHSVATMTSIRPQKSLDDSPLVRVTRTFRVEEDYLDTDDHNDISEKQALLMENTSKLEVQPARSIKSWSRNTFFLVLVLIFGYLVYLKSTFDESEVIEKVLDFEKPAFDLVKDGEPTLTSIPLTSATPQSPFLEVFQVYQPVLTPEGVIDNTINSTGSAETGIIDATTVATSCSQVLMVHDFAFSFGLPFVGMHL